MSYTVLDILDELEATSGRNDKEEILETHVKNKLLKRIFIAAQDPYTVYYVNKFPVPKPLNKRAADDDKVVTAFIDVLLADLSSRKITGNEAKATVGAAFQLMDARQQKWCQRILLKNLRCGVQESTVVKVWPGSIKSFAVALAATLKSEFVKGEGIKILEDVSYPVRVEPKLDGLRCIAVKKNGTVTFFTRNGTVLETLPSIKRALEDLDFDNVVFDGEAMGADWNESASVLMSSKTKKDDRTIVYNVFDAMPLDHWVAQETTMTYDARCEFVKIMFDSVQTTGVPFRQVPHIMAEDESQLKAYFKKCMDEGYEGVMLKTLDTPYKFKRSRNIMKLKPCVTYEGVIVGHYEGRHGTKREGLFGGFEVLFPNGVITRVGGGFNDAMRAQVASEGPDTWIGKIVELEAQPDPLTADGLTEDGKARFPVYMRTRDPSDVDPKVMKAYKAYKKGAK